MTKRHEGWLKTPVAYAGWQSLALRESEYEALRLAGIPCRRLNYGRGKDAEYATEYPLAYSRQALKTLKVQ